MGWENPHHVQPVKLDDVHTTHPTKILETKKSVSKITVVDSHLKRYLSDANEVILLQFWYFNHLFLSSNPMVSFSASCGAVASQRPGPPSLRPKHPPGPAPFGLPRVSWFNRCKSASKSEGIKADVDHACQKAPWDRWSSTYAFIPLRKTQFHIYWVLIKGKPRGFINPDFMKAGYLCQGGVCYEGTLWLTIAMIQKGSHLIIPKGPRDPPVGPRDPPIG